MKTGWEQRDKKRCSESCFIILEVVSKLERRIRVTKRYWEYIVAKHESVEFLEETVKGTLKMKPIRILYDEKGKTLYVRFSDKKEAYCTESDVDEEIIFSKAEDGSVIGFEILNYLSKGVEIGDVIPIETKIVKESPFHEPEEAVKV